MNPLHIGSDIWRHRYLLSQLVKRDVLLRYRGALGILWIFLSPLLMLAIFALIFGHIFQTRWPQQSNSMPLWVLLYSGLTIFNIFSETLSRAPMSVRSRPNYVKKVIFPVHILPVVPFGAALVHGAFNFLIMLIALGWVGELHQEILLLPVLLLPMLLLALGASWFLAACGVFIHEVSQVIPLLMQMLLFLSPVLYPVNAVPEILQPIYHYNPLGIVIDSCRAAITGAPIAWSAWTGALAACGAVSVLGHSFFQRSRDEFADVL